jgi:hypothetical protein
VQRIRGEQVVPMPKVRRTSEAASEAAVSPAEGGQLVLGVRSGGGQRDDAVHAVRPEEHKGLPTKEECIEGEHHGKAVIELCEWRYCRWCGLMLEGQFLKIDT